MYSLNPLFYINIPDNPEVIVYSEIKSNRLLYVLDFIFHRIAQKKYVLTNDIISFQQSDKVKINYSENVMQGCINVFPLFLIKNKGIDKTYSPNFSVQKEDFYFEDIFSKVFYFLSRYEEVQGNFLPDKHQRFEMNVINHKEIYSSPIVDIAVRQFFQYIQRHYDAFQTPYFYKVIYTFDLDNILAFKGKPIWRSAGAILKHLSKKEWSLLKKRVNVLFNNAQDPLEEVYDFIKILSQKHSVLFFVLCRSNTAYDRAASIDDEDTKRILNHLKDFAHIGLHPSYYSFNNEELIMKEKSILEKVIQQKIVASRQHYLRMDIRTTPKLLINQGFEYDFTMGFASAAGWRAGTSYPFYYYDFDTESATSLLFVPFVFMDGAYFNYQQISIDKALNHIQSIEKQVRDTGGYFIPLFHEMTLSSLFFSKMAEEWRMYLQEI
ncbi:MAG: polysaccharide deacetylase family protein [Bacteroidia bacterium]|nr:polysaccharide deacetylase family protein [Bacteroidia bacterium]